jgi:hypothetical protein
MMMRGGHSKTDFDGDIVLIVMESGGRWPACFNQLLRTAPHGVVLAQDLRESSAELGTRLRRRLGHVMASEQRVQSAVISAGPAAGPDIFVNRCLMVKALMRSLVSANGHLVLAAHANLPDTARQDIARVAATMTEHLAPGTSLTLELDGGPMGVKRAVRRPFASYGGDSERLRA